MKRHTRSILEEISQSVPKSSREALIESRASHVISSALNLIDMLYESYDENTAGELSRRLVNSIKSSDPAKFERGIRKIYSINESDRS
mgnify:FL=1|tara:strand:+ start:190 stop:453 length:264 start_codon:yes stop_codon:yes gene_type:complete